MRNMQKEESIEQISAIRLSLTEMEALEKTCHDQAVLALKQNREDLARQALAQKLAARRNAQELRVILDAYSQRSRFSESNLMWKRAEVFGRHFSTGLRISRKAWQRVTSHPNMKRVLSRISQSLRWKRAEEGRSQDGWQQLETIVRLNRELKSTSKSV